jgi:phosphatidylserine/phosphatidylglycerophosphate/cardiolipin synthase-like enzyme
MFKSNKIYFVVILLLIINGCNTSVTGNVVDENIVENDVKIQAYFCPNDDCDKVIADVVSNAEESVHCAFYDLDLKDLIKAFGKKSRNADVKVVIDHGNYDGQIKGSGIKIAKSKQYMHNKFCILDNDKVLTGSMNPTDNGANKNNNNLIIIDSKYLAENYEDEFDELWNGIYASGDKVKFNEINTNIGLIENYFCPEDCQGGEKKVLNLVRGANKSIKVAIFSFTHEDIGDELVKADIRGLDVEVLMERRQRNGQRSQYTRLKDFGINIKVDGNKYNLHHKFIIIDDKILITGSPNFSFSGYNRNDENFLIIYDESLVLRFVSEFEEMFGEGEILK